MMMEDIIQAVVERTGIPKEVAARAVAIVIEHLGKKLPEPLAQQVQSLLGGEDTSSPDLGDVQSLMKGLGGMFGK